MNENELVRLIGKTFEENKPSRLKKIFVHVNLATKKFTDIWASWWETEIPPRLEVDFIFAFEDIKKVIDDLLLVAVEVEYYRDKRKSFYDGLQQALSFGIFGFDSLVLWHIFDEELNIELISNYSKATAEIISGFDLPIIYMATIISKDLKFRFMYPWGTLRSENSNYVISSLMDLCLNKRNPLLSVSKPLSPPVEEIRKRRNTLKVMLKIPV